MVCNNCGKEIEAGTKFCPYCGKSFVKEKKEFLDKKQKIIVISLLLVVCVMLGLMYFFTGNNGKRTIMIYIVGSNLETDAKIVTADLAGIDPKKIDLSRTNILLYTGGTKKWHNDYISNEDNGVFILKANGFEKL